MREPRTVCLVRLAEVDPAQPARRLRMQTIFRCTLLIAFVVMDSACAPSPPDIRRLDEQGSHPQAD